MYESNAFFDTGAVQKAMSESELRKVRTSHTKVVLRGMPAPEFKIQIANGNLVKVTKRVFLRNFSMK